MLKNAVLSWQLQAKHQAWTNAKLVTAVAFAGLLMSLSSIASAKSNHPLVGGMFADNKPINREAHPLVGIAISVSEAGYANHDPQMRLLPSLIYDNNRVYVRGKQAGAYLINNRTDQLVGFAELSGIGFHPDDFKTPQTGLQERKSSFLVGASYQKLTPFGGFRGQIAQDITGRSQGRVAKLTYLSRMSKNQWRIYPSVGLEWHDKNYNNYYYGVTTQEARATKLQPYQANAGISPYASISATYQFSPRWSGYVSQNLRWLSDAERDSPLADSRIETATTLGISYQY